MQKLSTSFLTATMQPTSLYMLKLSNCHDNLLERHLCCFKSRRCVHLWMN